MLADVHLKVSDGTVPNAAKHPSGKTFAKVPSGGNAKFQAPIHCTSGKVLAVPRIPGPLTVEQRAEMEDIVRLPASERRRARYESAKGSRHPGLVLPTKAEWESFFEEVFGPRAARLDLSKVFTLKLNLGRHQRQKGINETYHNVEEDAPLDDLGIYLAEERAWELLCETLTGQRPIPHLACSSFLLRAEQTMDPPVQVWEHLSGESLPRLSVAQFREDVASRRCNYVHSKHSNVTYPVWRGLLDANDDSQWAEGEIEEDLRERGIQCWRTLLAIGWEIHVRTGDDIINVADIAHSGLNREMVLAALRITLPFMLGDHFDLEVAITEDESGMLSWSASDPAHRPAPDEPLDMNRRPFTERLASLPTLAEWHIQLSYLPRMLTMAEKEHLAWSLVRERNDPGKTKVPGWWRGVVGNSGEAV